MGFEIDRKNGPHKKPPKRETNRWMALKKNAKIQIVEAKQRTLLQNLAICMRTGGLSTNLHTREALRPAQLLCQAREIVRLVVRANFASGLLWSTVRHESYTAGRNTGHYLKRLLDGAFIMQFLLVIGGKSDLNRGRATLVFLINRTTWEKNKVRAVLVLINTDGAEL